jgi:hypothetical protein
MKWRTGLLVIAIVFGSCDKNISHNCNSFGADLAPGSVLDTITLNDGRNAVLLSTAACRYDTLILNDPIPDVVDTIPDVEDTIPANEDTVRSLIMGFGSSTIDRWDLQSAFPNKSMKKAGYKGGFIDQLLHLTDTIRRVKPDQILLYAGSNDVIAGKTTSQVTDALQGLMRKIWNENPGIHITYITMHPSDTAFRVRSEINGNTGVQTMEYVNANMKKWIISEHSNHASIVESYSAFLAWNPKRIDMMYYEPDKLHLNQTHGYPKLNELVRSLLK